MKTIINVNRNETNGKNDLNNQKISKKTNMYLVVEKYTTSQQRYGDSHQHPGKYYFVNIQINKKMYGEWIEIVNFPI